GRQPVRQGARSIVAVHGMGEGFLGAVAQRRLLDRQLGGPDLWIGTNDATVAHGVQLVRSELCSAGNEHLRGWSDGTGVPDDERDDGGRLSELHAGRHWRQRAERSGYLLCVWAGTG